MKRFLQGLLLFSAVAVHADINVLLTPAASANLPPIASGLQAITSITADTGITVTCTAGVDCQFVGVKVDTRTIPLSVEMPRKGTIPLNFVSSSGSALHIIGADGKDVAGGPFQLQRSPAPADQGTSSDQSSSNKAAADVVVPVQNPCDRVRFKPSYVQAANRAHFVVTTGGSIVQHPDLPIDENDVVVFHVVSADEDLLRNVEVSRVSPTRTTGDLSVIGGSVQFTKQSRSNVCFERQFELGDFAPGEAKVEIATVNNGQRTIMGTPTFTVNRLWDGILSLGPGWSRVADEAYGLAPNAAGQNVIVKTANGHNDILYLVHYTQYMWGRRDTDKQYPYHQHFNPSIGFSLSNFKEHALAGASFDWRQFVFTAGVHFAHVTRLAGDTKAGAQFSGAANTITTTKRWESGVYFAITVDARAAKVLLTSTGQ
jgi:hypothetical protein